MTAVYIVLVRYFKGQRSTVHYLMAAVRLWTVDTLRIKEVRG